MTETKQKEGAASETLRVLFADDHEPTRHLVALYLPWFGIECETARDGDEAFRLYARARVAGRPFDLVLLDVSMPVMDGYETCAKIRARGDTATPVVYVTAFEVPADCAVEVWHKPYIFDPPDKLPAAIRRKVREARR